MLPAEHRLRSRLLFSAAVRRGRRSGRATLTAHLLLAAPEFPTAQNTAGIPQALAIAESGSAIGGPAQAGLVVSKAVGGSVVRHAVARRLRHQLQPLVPLLPRGALLVVRASPPAATATSAQLGADLRAALRKLGVVGA